MFSPRGFSSIQEHDNAIITNWNAIVHPEDTIYVLGDLMLNDDIHGLSCLNQLNGTIKIIRGNHDTDTRIKLYEDNGYEVLGYATEIKYRKYYFYLSHYPTICSNYTDKNLHSSCINLCGHTHTNNRWIDWDKGIIYHCELDCHGNYPIALDDIIEDIKEKYSN